MLLSPPALGVQRVVHRQLLRLLHRLLHRFMCRRIVTRPHNNVTLLHREWSGSARNLCHGPVNLCHESRHLCHELVS